jgi:hypothetical protein
MILGGPLDADDGSDFACICCHSSLTMVKKKVDNVSDDVRYLDELTSVINGMKGWARRSETFMHDCSIERVAAYDRHYPHKANS